MPILDLFKCLAFKSSIPLNEISVNWSMHLFYSTIMAQVVHCMWLNAELTLEALHYEEIEYRTC